MISEFALEWLMASKDREIRLSSAKQIATEKFEGCNISIRDGELRVSHLFHAQELKWSKLGTAILDHKIRKLIDQVESKKLASYDRGSPGETRSADSYPLYGEGRPIPQVPPPEAESR